MKELYIARQPIYNKQLDLVGYELLYRGNEKDLAEIENEYQATSDTIIHSFMDVGIDNLVGSAQAYINFPKEFIVGDLFAPFFTEQSVLELSQYILPSKEVIDGLKKLKSQGYEIALDNFRYDEACIPLLDLADYVKIDVLNSDEEKIRQELDAIKDFGVKLIAQKVETQEMKELCVKCGFDYFQGFFFCKPQVIKQIQIPANKMVVLNLLNKIQDPEMDYDEFQVILSQDVTLSYKLLRYINSAMFGLRREIESIKDAVVLLGQDNVKKWLSLILLSRLDENKPNELIVVALTRGKMCELLASDIYPEIVPQTFIVGLFSVLDALMDRPMVELLDTVILSAPIKLALLDQSGDLGEVLNLVYAYEQFKFDELDESTVACQNLRNSYLEALNWAEESIKAIG